MLTNCSRKHGTQWEGKYEHATPPSVRIKPLWNFFKLALIYWGPQQSYHWIVTTSFLTPVYWNFVSRVPLESCLLAFVNLNFTIIIWTFSLSAVMLFFNQFNFFYLFTVPTKGNSLNFEKYYLFENERPMGPDNLLDTSKSMFHCKAQQMKELLKGCIMLLIWDKFTEWYQNDLQHYKVKCTLAYVLLFSLSPKQAPNCEEGIVLRKSITWYKSDKGKWPDATRLLPTDYGWWGLSYAQQVCTRSTWP